MISYLRGRLLQREPTFIVVDVGGIGYGLHVPLSTFYHLPSEGEEVELLVHTLFQNDGLALYGFSTPKERHLFELMISVRGVGPRVAMTLLSGMAAEELEKALLEGDVERLVRVPGIGKRTAERMVFELRDRLAPRVAFPLAPHFEDAVSALVRLGYPRSKAKEVLTTVLKERGKLSLEELLREALRRLYRGRG